MESAFYIVAAALPVWLALYGFYWWIIRPAILAKLRLTVVGIESEVLEMLLHSGRPERKQPLEVVLNRCKRATRNLGNLSLSRVILTEVSAETDASFKRERALLATSAPDIQKLDAALTYRLFFAVMANSPMFAVVGVGLASTIELFGTIRRAYNAVTDRTWEATADGSSACPPGHARA